MLLSSEGLKLILRWEVGGGQEFYDRFCKHPVVPDAGATESGITIGIGWDCGQQKASELVLEWGKYIPVEQLARLGSACGLKGHEALKFLPRVKDIEVPWDMALMQFEEYSVPRYRDLTCAAFAGIKQAPACVQEALLDLIYNRGTTMQGDRRREMRTIRDLVEDGEWAKIPAQIRAMKRLWPEAKGLRDRRDDEAKHIENGLAGQK